MTFGEFHNAIKVLWNIDKPDWMTFAQWGDFSGDPHKYLVSCDDMTAHKLWALAAPRINRPEKLSEQAGVVMRAFADELLHEHAMDLKQIALIAANLPGEAEEMNLLEAERAWERQQDALMESGGPDDTQYRRDMKDAGRGHLVKP